MLDQIGLNHAFVVVPEDVYERILEEESLRNFAFCEEKTTRGEEGEWTGFYLYGSQTYLEIFPPSGRYPKVGQWGLGLGGDQSGLLSQLLSGSQSSSLKEGVFKRDGRDWFHYLYAKDPIFYEGCYLWLMEYAFDHEAVSRRDYNRARYAETKDFLDVISMTVTLEEEALLALRNRLGDFGYEAKNTEAGLQFSFKDFHLNLMEGKEKKFSFGLSSKEGSHTFDFQNLLQKK